LQGGYNLMASVHIELGTRKVHVDVDIAHDVIQASHAKDGQPALHWGKVSGKPDALQPTSSQQPIQQWITRARLRLSPRCTANHERLT
jgi:hypothetical protein